MVHWICSMYLIQMFCYEESIFYKCWRNSLGPWILTTRFRELAVQQVQARQLYRHGCCSEGKLGNCPEPTFPKGPLFQFTTYLGREPFSNSCDAVTVAPVKQPSSFSCRPHPKASCLRDSRTTQRTLVYQHGRCNDITALCHLCQGPDFTAQQRSRLLCSLWDWGKVNISFNIFIGKKVGRITF